MRYFLFRWLFVLIPFGTSAQKLHLILASDYGNVEFGMVSLKDEEVISAMFGKISRQLDHTFRTVYINKNTQEGFTAGAVQKALADTSIRANDIVIFYYSGFGTHTAASASPSLQFANTDLLSLEKYSLFSLDAIADLLQPKRLRLGMVMADCRNTLTRRYPTPINRTTVVQEDRSKEILKKLFLSEPCRILKIAGAQKGKPVLAIERNSVFTYSLTEAVEDMLYAKTMQEVTLDNLFNRVNKITKSFIPEYTGLSKVPLRCPAPARPAAVRASR